MNRKNKSAIMTLAASAIFTASAETQNPAQNQARKTTDFLDSIGIVTTFPDRGQPLEKTIEMVNYCGFRWVRGGIEGLSEKEDGRTTIDTYIKLCKATGMKANWGLVSGGSDLDKLLRTARRLHEEGVLLAFEGNNEPNNWGVVYKGEKGGRNGSWVALANLQSDMYKAVKADPQYKKYPVWGASEMGAQTDNVGMHFLEIPEGADTVMPAGTKYQDALNVHNYIYHPNSPRYEDNKTWNCADPGPACKVDGLWGNHGVTWGKKFKGYGEAELADIPRVTTETGTTIGGDVTEEIHALHLTNIYLAQFARGWSHTSVYLLRDRTDEGGNQTFGFYDRDYKPRKAALYLHNLTTVLQDKGDGETQAAGTLAYAIENRTPTVHDLLLQHSSGKFQLVVWGEKAKGSDTVTVRFPAPKSVKIFDVTKGVEPVRTLEATSSFDLEMSDHPFVLEVK